MSAGAAAGSGRTEQRFPWQLGLAVFAWVVLGITSIVSATGGKSSSEADAGSVGRIQEGLGSSAVATRDATANPVLLVSIGLAVLLFAGLLALGQGWARWVLVVVGFGAVIYFASAVGWMPAMIAMAVLIVGSVPLLAPSANRYLAG